MARRFLSKRCFTENTIHSGMAGRLGLAVEPLRATSAATTDKDEVTEINISSDFPTSRECLATDPAHFLVTIESLPGIHRPPGS